MSVERNGPPSLRVTTRIPPSQFAIAGASATRPAPGRLFRTDSARFMAVAICFVVTSLPATRPICPEFCVACGKPAKTFPSARAQRTLEHKSPTLG